MELRVMGTPKEIKKVLQAISGSEEHKREEKTFRQDVKDPHLIARDDSTEEKN